MRKCAAMPTMSNCLYLVNCFFSSRHNGQLHNYYIFSKHEHFRVRYTIRTDEGYRWDSLHSLIGHYHRHPIDGGDLLLTAPVV